MSEIDPDYSADPAFSTVILNIPPHGIDLRVILRALRYELLHSKLAFSYDIKHRYQIVIPTLRKRFRTRYRDGYIEMRTTARMVRIPAEISEQGVSDRTIDLMCAYLELWKINYRL